MNTVEKRPRREHELMLVNAARKALDKGEGPSALPLVDQITEFWPQAMIILMSVICFQARDQGIRKRALVLFHKHLLLCENFVSLEGVASWARNPIRTRRVPGELLNAIDHHRKSLDSGWDGVWHNSGVGQENRIPVVLKKEPAEVCDKDDCLGAANQSANWSPWLARYRELGGNTEDPRYLKTWVSKAVSTDRKPGAYTLNMLRLFTRFGKPKEVKTFLRRITPVRNSFVGRNPNYELARFALLLYCECGRLEHGVEDWLHISLSAQYLRCPVIERIVQRVLAGLERTPEAQRVFEQLAVRYGEIRVTQWARDDIGITGNPIWRSVYRLIPANADARSILADYSRRELDVF